MPFTISSFGDVTVPQLPAVLAESPRSAEGKEVAGLYRAALDATARVAEVRQAANLAQERLRAAELAYGAELDRGATAERNTRLETKLATELNEARLAAEPEIHQRRHRAAVDAQRRAVQTYGDSFYVNATRLISELALEAHDATEALAAARSKIQPEIERYAAARAAVQSIIRVVAQSRDEEVAWALPQSDSEPPLPAATTLEWHDRRYHPEVAEVAA
jgi:hypothetical protein